ncbi:MAG: Arc family DNA-binding protein, partial [Pseudomonas sp.]
MRPLKQAIYSSRTADKFVVRLPDGMRERIAEVARNHHRSMNSEIIARLE